MLPVNVPVPQQRMNVQKTSIVTSIIPANLIQSPLYVHPAIRLHLLLKTTNVFAKVSYVLRVHFVGRMLLVMPLLDKPKFLFYL